MNIPSLDPELLRALNLANGPAEATYRFETPAGRIIDRKLAGVAPGPGRMGWQTPRAQPPLHPQ